MSRPTLRDLMNSRTGGRLAGKSINSAIENFRNDREIFSEIYAHFDGFRDFPIRFSIEISLAIRLPA